MKSCLGPNVGDTFYQLTFIHFGFLHQARSNRKVPCLSALSNFIPTGISASIIIFRKTTTTTTPLNKNCKTKSEVPKMFFFYRIL